LNIIYLLTNLDKTEGRRFYVGSKAECFIENIKGIDRIVSAKTGLPYYGSSSCPLMKEDMAKGARLEAILNLNHLELKAFYTLEDQKLFKSINL
jgi:hypothetical protein